jgi:hypothetical protein
MDSLCQKLWPRSTIQRPRIPQDALRLTVLSLLPESRLHKWMAEVAVFALVITFGTSHLLHSYAFFLHWLMQSICQNQNYREYFGALFHVVNLIQVMQNVVL